MLGHRRVVAVGSPLGICRGSARDLAAITLVFVFDRVAPLWQWRASRSCEISMERSVAKAEWGTKRICPSCGTRYYDLLREPVICPKCDTPYDPEAFLRSRRARPAAPVEKEIQPVEAEELDADLEPEEADAVEDEEEETVALEDAEEED